jgi:hypothetical protein
MEAAESVPSSKRVIHTSFIVKDVYESIRGFLDVYGVGPWFVFEHYPMHGFQYRGEPSQIDFTVAIAYSGPMLFELIQQNNDVPSAYQEVISEKGYGFHHFAIGSDDYDGDIARLREQGFTVVNEGASPPDHGGSRGAYVDTRSRLPGMTEVLELVPEMRSALSELQAIAAQWDGTDPIRIQKFS